MDKIRLPPLGPASSPTEVPTSGYIRLPAIESEPAPAPFTFDSSKLQDFGVTPPTATAKSTPVITAPGTLIKQAKEVGKAVVTHPVDTTIGFGKGALNATFAIGAGLAGIVGADSAQKYIEDNQEAMNQAVDTNLNPEAKADKATAIAVGNFVGEQYPYFLAGEGLAKLGVGVAASVLSEYGGKLTPSTISTIGKIVRTASDAAGFIGLDQITASKKDESRLQLLKKDLLVLSVLGTVGYGASKLSELKSIKDTRNFVETIKDTKPKLPELEAKVQELNKNIEFETGVKPKDLVPEAIQSVPETTKVEPKVVKVSRAQLPVGEGETLESSLGARVKSSLDSIPEADRSLVPNYQQMNKKEQIAAAVKYVTENPDEAMEVLKGNKPAPKGLLNNSIFVAMQQLGSKDPDLALQLASLKSTRFGQEISILTEVDPHSPVKYLSNVIQSRIEALGGQQKLNELLKQETGKIKSTISKSNLSKVDWDSFIESIKCQ